MAASKSKPKEYSCERCGSTGKVLYVPVTAGKMTRMDNCPRCNRNGRRKPNSGSIYVSSP